jgi:hypothetical protein
MSSRAEISCTAFEILPRGVDLGKACPYYPLTSKKQPLRERVAQLVEQLTFNQ